MNTASSIARPTNTDPTTFMPARSTLPSTGEDAVPAQSLEELWARQNIFSDPDEDRLDTSLGRPAAPPTFSVRRLADVRKQPTTAVEVLAEWNGCVTGVQHAGYSFSAILTGIIGEGVRGEEEEATIPTADVSEWDKDLLRPGNFFRLCVIHEVLPSGQPRRYTQVVFRRLPAYRQQDLDQAGERGRELAGSLHVE